MLDTSSVCLFQNIIVFLEKSLDQYRYNTRTLHITTYHRIVLTIGAVARKLQVTDKQMRADKLISQLHDMLQIHGICLHFIVKVIVLKHIVSMGPEGSSCTPLRILREW